jgi:DNA-binding GntR family transcriptional regulator
MAVRCAQRVHWYLLKRTLTGPGIGPPPRELRLDARQEIDIFWCLALRQATAVAAAERNERALARLRETLRAVEAACAHPEPTEVLPTVRAFYSALCDTAENPELRDVVGRLLGRRYLIPSGVTDLPHFGAHVLPRYCELVLHIESGDHTRAVDTLRRVMIAERRQLPPLFA